MTHDIYRQFFDSIDEIFCVIDVIFDGSGKAVDWRYLETNQHFVSRITITDPVGKLISEVDPYTEPYWFDFCGQVATSGVPARMENLLKGLDCWFDVFAFKVGEPESKQIGVLFRDITDRKQAESALRESEQRANALVEELEATDKNKNLFISVLSHELRNPLTISSGALAMLDLDSSSEQVALSKDIVTRQMRHLTKLVDDLLDFTRISQNKIKLKKEAINLNEVLRNVSLDIKPQFEAKNIELTVTLPEGLVLMHADPVRITQCIGNLLQNALKFTQANGKVVLSLHVEDNRAIIRILDNGIGIDTTLLAHIFEPFIQADDSTNRPNSGLGLGLSITNNIVQLHGGSVSVHSAGIGTGATFTIILPITD